MQNTNLSIGDSIKFGWDSTFKNFKFLGLSLLISFGVSFLAEINLGHHVANSLAETIVLIATMYISYGILKGTLQITENQTPSLGVLTQTTFHQIARYLLITIINVLIRLLALLPMILSVSAAYLMTTEMPLDQLDIQTPQIIMLAAPLLISIILSIYISLRFAVVDLVVIDQNLSIWGNFKESGILTKGHKAKIFLFWIVLGLFNLAGLFALIIGLLVTIPATMVASAHFYKTLKQLKA